MLPMPKSDISRRDWMKLGAAGALGMPVAGWMHSLAAATQDAPRKYKSCIVLWMHGGPSQAHTFDVKAQGEVKTIKTSAPGIEIAETLPKVAEQMHHFAVLPTMATKENNHPLGSYLMRTGFRRGTGSYPGLGAIVGSEVAPEFTPNFVALSGTSYPVQAGYLGGRFSPLVLNTRALAGAVNGGEVIKNIQAKVDDATLQSRFAALTKQDEEFLKLYRDPAIEAHLGGYQRALQLMQSDKILKAFKYTEEPQATQDLYGSSTFGNWCLTARRLVEVGVPFVEVVMPEFFWDDHKGDPAAKKAGCEKLDQPMAALMADLKQRGLLDTTLVIWMGEFGRSPIKGSEHNGNLWTILMGGAGLKVGQRIGETDAKGAAIKSGRPISAPDFVATVCKALGIDHEKQKQVAGRPIALTNKGQPVEELF